MLVYIIFYLLLCILEVFTELDSCISSNLLLGKSLNRLQQDFGKLPIINSPTKFKKNTHSSSPGIFPRKEKLILH